MKKISLIAIMLLAIVVVAGAGCSKTATENAAESTIESASGGSADVDIDNNTMRLETEEGTMEVGENVSLPDDFPSDVYVVEGSLIAASKTADNSFSVSIETTKSVSDIQDIYEAELADDGWDVNTTLAFAGLVTLGGEKDDRMVTVSISEDEGKTIVIITTVKTE